MLRILLFVAIVFGVVFGIAYGLSRARAAARHRQKEAETRLLEERIDALQDARERGELTAGEYRRLTRELREEAAKRGIQLSDD